MKRILSFLFILLAFALRSQIGYNFTALGGAFTANAGPTIVHATGVDDAISASINIGFTFPYGCTNNYTTFQVSSNGVMFLGTAAAGSNVGNNLNTGTDRPAIAPLWDDLATGTGGNVNYRLTGASPNRVLTVEWLNMEWSYSATVPVISFQAKLYETSGRIEFVYRQEAGAVVVNGASIGISGPTSGDFYSLNGTGAAPAASKVTETTNLSTKPATGQIYRWDPQICSGVPAAGLAVASPSLRCAAYTTTLSLSGASAACSITYQWQSATALAGPWTNLAGATNYTATANVTANIYYRCILTCGASTAASTPAPASLTPSSACGLCGVTPITLPYTANGVTTCGSGNDLTAAMVANACSSTSYLGGEDVIYTFTPSVTGQISITYSTSGSSAAAMLYSGCPNSGGTCAGNVTGISSFSGNQTFCAMVTAGQPYFLVIDSWPSPTCNGYNVAITSPTASANACSLSTYNAAGTAYTFETFVGTNAPQTDDILFNNTVNLGFNFCFAGSQYNTAYIASNGAIVFPAVPCFPNIQTTTYAAPGVSTGYTIPSAAPVNNTSIPRNAILGPWHDIDPSLGGLIEYATLGVAPNRRFVVSYDQIPMFSCGVAAGAAQFFSGQIKIYETTGNIEIHVRNKQLCSSWNGGAAVMGLHNFDGTIYRPPTASMVNHNYPTQWTMTNTGYRWTSACANCNVLPIQFKNFYGERVDRVNKLYWETAVEDNMKSFSVERSSDAENFEQIAMVPANGKPGNYQYDDATTKPGTLHYYRITAIENDGKRSSTQLVTLGANIGEIVVSGIYPNPTQNDFTMVIDSRVISEATIKIYDMLGNVVRTYTRTISVGMEQYHVNVSDLASGSYMMEVSTPNKEVFVQQKLVKVD